ncbi:MAG: T9SS type A sorting domain-containing protein [candidate division Zixibacteria bacterium]|nr:T9SS type A sorting domain-containing protein [Candidatus Tariuqbacter arcticus]
MNHKRSFITIIAAVILLMVCASSPFAGELYPLYPKMVKLDRAGGDLNNQGGFPVDPQYPISHHDGVAEYYLGSGALNDTFFIVFEPLAPCSVHWVEIEWFDGGNVDAFAAWYSDEANLMYPGGIAPERGQSPVSPIGDFITPLVPNSIIGYGWQTLDLGGVEWIAGGPTAPDIFGVGYIKSSETPHPLADGVSAYGINYSYTWFGGPWVLQQGYDNAWGAYSSDYSGTVVELMMTAWISYIGGMPILISDVTPLCDSYSLTGPFTVSCHLEDDPPGITGDDLVLLQYQVNGGDIISIPMVEVAPGSGNFQAGIYGSFSPGDEITYWIYTLDDTGLENISLPQSFDIVEPENPDADLLLVDDGLSDRYTAYLEVLDDNGIEYEYWEVYEHNGIDESVVNWGWGNILLAGWGVSTLSALDEPNAYSGFLDDGGNLCLIDQDYFYANGLPAQGTFAPGDFAYEYFGLNEYWNDPIAADAIYAGEAGDPITGPFEDDHYVTYWDETGIHMSIGSFWADYVSAGNAEVIFYGVNDAEIYGVRYDAGTFKTVFLSFMAEASCEIVSGNWTASDQFETLILNIFEWFDTYTPPGEVSITLTPHNPPIYIPSGGGSFLFDLLIENTTSANFTVDVWTDITLPGGAAYPIIIREGVGLPAGANVLRPDLTQFVPGTALPGEYIYNGYVRDHNTWEVLSYDSFPFEKLPGDGAPTHDLGWALFGWDGDAPPVVSSLPTEFKVHPPCPNPFNPQTTISLELPRMSRVELEIYNIQGRLVETLFEGYKSPGVHQFTWNAENLPSGIYFYQLETDLGNETGRMVLMK